MGTSAHVWQIPLAEYMQWLCKPALDAQVPDAQAERVLHTQQVSLSMPSMLSMYD